MVRQIFIGVGLAVLLVGCCCPEDSPEITSPLRPVEPEPESPEPESGDLDDAPDEDEDQNDGFDEDKLSDKGNTEIPSFRTSKKIVRDEIFAGNKVTFYCGCKYGKDKVQLGTCGYKARKNSKRARRVEIEHIVPASVYGSQMPSWQDGHETCLDSKKKPYAGRRCAEKRSSLFKHMEADMYNLRPSIGEVNGDRSNYPMAEIRGEAREYGECDVEIEGQRVEPKASIRGDIARVYKYMDWAYPGLGIIDSSNRAMFDKWDKADPVTAAERAWARKVEARQGNKNPFVK